MGDDNMNNMEEDTSVLFVSAQKKKKAEEEAQKKAAEEKAKKEAMEAEIKRQEAEVASRKSKAEDLKKELESKEEERNKHKTKNKIMPIAIGAGVAVVILIGVLAWPKPKKAYAEIADFNAEYKTTKAGYDLKMMYPDTVFTGAGESASGDELEIVFEGKEKSSPKMDVIAAKTGYDDISKNLAWKEINDKLESVAKEHLKGAEIIEERISDPLDRNCSKYEYKCTYTLDKESGAYAAWCIQNGSGNVIVEAVDCKAGKKDMESAVRLRDQFVDVNSKNNLTIPGQTKYTNIEPTDQFVIDELKLGLRIPKDMFKDAGTFREDGGKWYKRVDENGAVILAGVFLYCKKEDYIPITAEMLPDLYQMYKEAIEKSLDKKVDFTDRKFTADVKGATYDYDYTCNYSLKIGGRDYIENDYMSLAAVDENIYTLIIYVLGPRIDGDTYYTIFNNMYKGADSE